MRLTASKIWLAVDCAYPFSSAVPSLDATPCSGAALRGRLMHSVCEHHVNTQGVDNGPAWDELNESDRKACLRTLEWISNLEPSWKRKTEVCYGYSPFSGARRFDVKERSYAEIPADYLPGTVDLVLHSPRGDEGIVVDYKTGKSSAVNHKHQLDYLGMAVMRACGYDRVRCCVAKVSPLSRAPTFWEIDKAESDRLASDIDKLLFSIENAQPSLCEGCRFCDVRIAGLCPKWSFETEPELTEPMEW